MHRFLLFLSLFAALTQSQAGLAEFDAIIAQGEANNDINPIAKLTSPITLDGSSGVPFNFGSTLFDTTIEFIVMGNASAIDVGTLAAGSNTDFELRFAQWNNTGRLGFTHFGNQDYVTTVRSPQVLTHVCYRWDELNTGGSPTVNTMEIYINGHLTQSIVAPDFEMPKGNGFLGGRGPTASHAMAGRIDRVVVHNRAIFPAQIYRHACAFLEQPYQSNYDPILIDYDASESDANPVSQGWTVEEATIPGADNDANGLLDGVANVGLVSGPAWQIYDRRTEDALNAPRYRHAITRPELTALYENGWTFTAKVRAVGVSHATSSFVGWQFRKGLDPGFGVVGSGRVGFHFFESSDGEFVVNPTFKPAVNLGPGSGDQVHTIKAVGRPRSAGFEWFVNDVSQGYLDIRDFPYGDDESIMIGANSSGGLGDGADWFEVSLESNASLGITEEVERIEREVVAHSESIVADGVDAATGAFMRAQDLLTVHGVRTIDFPVYYDSRLTARVGPLGYGWSHPYEARLVCYGSDRVMIHWDAHRTSEFVYDSADSNHRRYFKGVDEDVRYGVLIEHTFEAAFLREIWKLTLLDGTSYGFELGSGRLIYVANSARQYLEMQYDSGGRLVAIKDKASDASISLDYNERGLIANVRDPLGREVLLDYDDQWRLTCLPAPFLLDEDTDYVSAEDVIIPDNQAAGVLIPIPVNTGGVVGLAYIHQLVVLHDRPSDLTFYLRSASGTEVEIPHAETLTEFDLSGFFERNAFDGELRRGDWALRVVDDVPGATGELIGSVILRLSDSFRAICLSYDGPLITAGVDVLGDPLFSNVYDAKGRVVSQDDGRAETPPTTFSYLDQGGGLTNTQVVDPLGCVFQFVHDEDYRLVSVTNPLGSRNAFTYDSNGNRTSRTDARGKSTQFSYDTFGNLTSVTDAANNTTTFSSTPDHFVTEITDPLGRETSFHYLEQRMTEVTDALGHIDRKSYWDSGQVKSVQLHDNSDLQFTRNANGLFSGISNTGGSGPGAEQDEAGRLTASWISGQSPFTERTTYTYTPASDILTTENSEGGIVTNEYDHRGRRIRTVDARGYATAFTYNGNNSLVTATDPLGHVIRYEHDHLDRVVRVISPTGQATSYQYDAAGRQVAVTDPLGRTTRTEYDAVGNVVARYDATGARVASITYDNRNLAVRVEDALGHASTAVYDALGRKTSATDSLGRTTTFHYDELDRPTGVTDALGRRSTATYQSDDVVNTLKGPGAQPVEFTYDRTNKITKIQRFSGQRVRYTYYGNAGNLNGIESEQRMTRMDYDLVGRVSLNTVESGWRQDDFSRSYTYDLNGNLTKIGTRGQFDNSFTDIVSREYDASNRMTKFTDEQGNTLTYTYDANGNLASLGYPDGWTVTYTYDAADRLTTVTDGDARVTTYSYNRRDQITQVAFANGAVRNMRYDRLGQLLYREDLDANGTTIVSYQYAYDSQGRIQSEQVDPDPGPILSSAQTMTFDQEYQLTTLNGQAITYDRDGNMIDNGSVALTYNARNRLRTVGTQLYDYDEEDNLVGWGTTKFVVNPAGPLAQIVTKREGNGTPTRYVWGIGLLYQESEGETQTFHYDHVGSTVALSNDEGLTSGRVSYNPYGKITLRAGETDTLFLYNGLFGVVTSPEGLNYMRFRWYWPEAGRFVNMDAHFGSVTDIASLNRFGYAAGNPILYVDPKGEFVNLIAAGFGAVVGAVVGAGAELIGAAASGEPVDFGRVGAAAVGGAVAGGLAGLTAGASTAVTIGVAIGAGAAGGVTESLVGSAIKGEAVDFGEVLESAGYGAAGGVLGVGAGKLIGKAGNKIGGKILKKIGSGGGKLRTFAREMFTPDHLLKRQAGRAGDFIRRTRIINGREFARDLLVDLGVSSALAGFTRPEAIAPSGGGGGGGVGSTTIYLQGMHEINANRTRAYGEYIHYDTFLSALSLANRPVPNNPSNTLGGF